ncbi:hypothetical protein DPEC_G00122630 [Dallia pectoralis]|uniref:Uncharacterized protein n=1 Tax=Dallia pectoralis TaxID=75939 RepID=A0ACC2GQ97_DALPE|nr:hypothetical protein DPEC_G00122630 [Dallia pectoralis]
MTLYSSCDSGAGVVLGGAFLFSKIFPINQVKPAIAVSPASLVHLEFVVDSWDKKYSRSEFRTAFQDWSFSEGKGWPY